MATKQVTLTINGKQATVPEGTTVVDAAKSVGIDIPVFCHHPKLEPVGMCRMCLVEIGRPMLDRATGQAVMENGQPKISVHAQTRNGLHQSRFRRHGRDDHFSKSEWMVRRARLNFCSLRIRWIVPFVTRAANVRCKI